MCIYMCVCVAMHWRTCKVAQNERSFNMLHCYYILYWYCTNMIIVSCRVHCVVWQIHATILDDPSVSIFRKKTSVRPILLKPMAAGSTKILVLYLYIKLLLPPGGDRHSRLQDNLKSYTSLSYCLFRALQIIYKSLQYQQMHISTTKLTAINAVSFSNMIPAP